MSFDGLKDKHKEIFLDVACFFKGWYIAEVEKILDSCGSATSLGIAILVERCLVTVDGIKIQMHDLLGVMGQNVVRADYLNGVGLPSRIWLYEDFVEVLLAQEKHGVKRIVLNLAEMKDSLVKPNALMGFKNLKIFIARNVDGPEKPLMLPGELRWFEWRGYSASSIEFDQSSNKIVNLDLAESRITKIKGKGFTELKYLNLGECMSLTSLDDLLAGDCDSLAKVSWLLRSKRLQTLAFWGYRKLNRLPAFKEELKFLQELTLSGTSLKELPESIGNLIALKQLNMSGCEHLSFIPHDIYKLRALEVLRLDDCPKLGRFPRKLVGSAENDFGLPNLWNLILSNCRLKNLEFLEDLTCFSTLVRLILSDNEFTRVPWCLRKFKNLKWLDLHDCRSLIEVPELPSHSISYLNATKCFNLRTFPSLHTFICESGISCMASLSGCGLGRNFMVESLPLEKVRGFTGQASVVCSANELPQWVNFQTTECVSRYQVSLPRSMWEDNILGLTFFITMECQSCDGWFDFLSAQVVVGGQHLRITLGKWEGVHTWFMYIPRRPFLDYSPYEILNWHSITLEFPKCGGLKYRSLGLRMLCKREEDDQRIRVRKTESNEREYLESEYESGFECLWEFDDEFEC